AELRTTLRDDLDEGVREAAGVVDAPAPTPDSPLAASAMARIRELGGVARAPYDPSAPRPVATCSWARERRSNWRGVDEAGFVPTMSPVAAWLDRQIEWTKGATFATHDADFPSRTVTVSTASECFDVLDRDRRRLLYVVGHCSLQWFYCVDLLDTSDDPIVYLQDHEGGPPSATRSLTE